MSFLCSLIIKHAPALPQEPWFSRRLKQRKTINIIVSLSRRYDFPLFLNHITRANIASGVLVNVTPSLYFLIIKHTPTLLQESLCSRGLSQRISTPSSLLYIATMISLYSLIIKHTSTMPQESSLELKLNNTIVATVYCHCVFPLFLNDKTRACTAPGVLICTLPSFSDGLAPSSVPLVKLADKEQWADATLNTKARHAYPLFCDANWILSSRKSVRVRGKRPLN